MLNMKQPLWERRCPYAKLIVAFFIGRREGGEGTKGRRKGNERKEGNLFIKRGATKNIPAVKKGVKKIYPSEPFFGSFFLLPHFYNASVILMNFLYCLTR